MANADLPQECRAASGAFYRIVGEGEPLLLLHGIMVSGAMFDPLIPLLQDRFRILVPDLRGHGNSRDVPGPYDVAALTGDLDGVLRDAGFERCAVMGYSHGGTVAQQLAHMRPAAVTRLMLVCTYAHNVSSLQERLECEVFKALLYLFTPAMLATLIFRASKLKPNGAIGLTREQAEFMRGVMAVNRAPAMRLALQGLIDFDSRPWLGEIAVPTVVVGATHDHAVPRHHYDTLIGGIPDARGRLVDRADHTLVWTHTRELADIMRAW